MTGWEGETTQATGAESDAIDDLDYAMKTVTAITLATGTVAAGVSAASFYLNKPGLGMAAATVSALSYAGGGGVLAGREWNRAERE